MIIREVQMCKSGPNLCNRCSLEAGFTLSLPGMNTAWACIYSSVQPSSQGCNDSESQNYSLSGRNTPLWQEQMIHMPVLATESRLSSDTPKLQC